jgi:hypothetical protein
MFRWRMVCRRGLLTTLLALLLGSGGVGSSAARAQELTIWHDLGDNNTKWFAAAGEAFAKAHPGITIRAISYPTDQWFGHCIGAINTGTAPDLIYNSYERVIRVAAQTHKLVDMQTVLAKVADKDFLSADDLRVATYAGQMIILPVQRVQMAFGVRKSWLDKVGPIQFFLFEQFFRTIPAAMIEAASVDGASELQVLWLIVLPMARGVVATVAVITFLLNWAQWFPVMVVSASPDTYTLPVALLNLNGELGTNFQGIMALAVITTVPPALLFLLAQRQVMSGMTEGAIKG